MANDYQAKFFTAPPSNQIITDQTQSIQSVQIINPINLGPQQMRLICPACRSDIQTIRRYQSSTMTHLLAILLFGICCCCLPYCYDSCRNTDHYCPKCNTYIGTYR